MHVHHTWRICSNHYKSILFAVGLERKKKDTTQSLLELLGQFELVTLSWYPSMFIPPKIYQENSLFLEIITKDQFTGNKMYMMSFANDCWVSRDDFDFNCLPNHDRAACLTTGHPSVMFTTKLDKYKASEFICLTRTGVSITTIPFVLRLLFVFPFYFPLISAAGFTYVLFDERERQLMCICQTFCFTLNWGGPNSSCISDTSII